MCRSAARRPTPENLRQPAIKPWSRLSGSELPDRHFQIKSCVAAAAKTKKAGELAGLLIRSFDTQLVSDP